MLLGVVIVLLILGLRVVVVMRMFEDVVKVRGVLTWEYLGKVL